MLPARAGVFPDTPWLPRQPQGAPRACGGIPVPDTCTDRESPCSPRVRGCPRPGPGRNPPPSVVPARAGVSPSNQSLPARVICGPRACGGVPRPKHTPGGIQVWSPRVRGCSRPDPHPDDPDAVVPVHAGVVPRSAARAPSREEHTAAAASLGDGRSDLHQAAVDRTPQERRELRGHAHFNRSSACPDTSLQTPRSEPTPHQLDQRHRNTPVTPVSRELSASTRRGWRGAAPARAA